MYVADMLRHGVVSAWPRSLGHYFLVVGDDDLDPGSCGVEFFMSSDDDPCKSRRIDDTGSDDSIVAPHDRSPQAWR
jgi:hypothetical protein